MSGSALGGVASIAAQAADPTANASASAGVSSDVQLGQAIDLNAAKFAALIASTASSDASDAINTPTSADDDG